MATSSDQANRYMHETYDESSGSVSCKWFVDRSFFCVTPGHQATHFYREGLADECTGTWKNLYYCLRAKAMDKERRKEFLQGTPLDMSRPPHTAKVWEAKETPGW